MADEPPREKAASFLESVLHQYSLVFLVLLAIVLMGLSRFLGERIAWFGLAWVVVAVAVFVLRRRHWEALDWSPRRTAILALIGGLTVFALTLRLAPYAHTNVPIGYDYGFYKAAMQAYEAAAPSVPEGALPEWIKAQFEPGLLILHQVLYLVAGLDAHTHLTALFPILSALLVLPIYTTTRNHFGTGAGLAAAGFYVASFAQYTVFQYMYEKNTIGLFLLLVLFFTTHERKWVASGILLGALGILHRPTFLLAVATVAVVGAYDMARTRDVKGWATFAGVSVPLFLPVWIVRFEHFIPFGFGVIERAGENVGLAVPEGGGTFLNFVAYQNAAVTYLPLALAGAFLLLWRVQALLPVVAFALSYLNVLFHFVFFNRFIIMLDLVALPLVTAAVMAATRGLTRWVRPAALVALLTLTAIPTVHETTREPHPPYVWINDEQREGILWLGRNTPSDATILASNLDSPYVIADSGRRTYGPGLFDDPHSGTEWRRFFQTTNETEIRQFLAAYEPPLFIYHAQGHGPGLGTAKFQAPLFERVYDEGGAIVWRYAG